MTVTVTLGKRPEYTPEEMQERIRRAASALEGCGWVFDEHISALTKHWIDTSPDEGSLRDELYYSIRAATDLKGRLVQIVNSKALEDKRNARPDRTGG